MREELLILLYRIWKLGDFLRLLNEIADREGFPVEEVHLGSELEHHDPDVQEALRSWAREKGCPIDEVPVILATETLYARLAAELQRLFFREKEGIIVAEGKNWQSLLERLTEKYNTPEHLADYLHIELTTQLPEILKRARRVRPLVLAAEVPETLRRRYREAVRSFLFRCFFACCALCRPVMEEALKETWERRFPGQANPDRFTFAELIDSIVKVQLLHVEITKLCRDVKERGDRAVHGEAILQSDDAYRSLDATQQILRCLFAELPTSSRLERS